MVKIGDVFYINTKKGRYYFQYMKRIPKFSYMIRVFSKDCDNKTENIEGIINMPVLFWIFFPLISAEKQKVIHKYGHVPIDKEKIKIVPMILFIKKITYYPFIFKSNNIHSNAQMRAKNIKEISISDEGGKKLRKIAMKRISLSARA